MIVVSVSAIVGGIGIGVCAGAFLVNLWLLITVDEDDVCNHNIPDF